MLSIFSCGCLLYVIFEKCLFRTFLGLLSYSFIWNRFLCLYKIRWHNYLSWSWRGVLVWEHHYTVCVYLVAFVGELDFIWAQVTSFFRRCWQPSPWLEGRWDWMEELGPALGVSQSFFCVHWPSTPCWRWGETNPSLFGQQPQGLGPSWLSSLDVWGLLPTSTSTLAPQGSHTGARRTGVDACLCRHQQLAGPPLFRCCFQFEPPQFLMDKVFPWSWQLLLQCVAGAWGEFGWSICSP